MPTGDGVDAGGNTAQPEREDSSQGNRPPRERGERGPRTERSGRGPRNGPRNEAGLEGNNKVQADAGPDSQRLQGEERAGIREDEGSQRRGNGRGSRRGPRRQDGDAPDDALRMQSNAVAAPDSVDADQRAAQDQGTQPEGMRSDNGEAREPRERRSRDRYGRDRSARGERPQRDAADMGESLMAMVPDMAAPAHSEHPRPVATATAAAGRADPDMDHAAPAPAPGVASQVRPVGMPTLQPFSLPLDTLESVAQSAGLQWVNSNPDLVAKAQAAIAAAVPPVREPRQRPAPVAVNTEPLVLVETRRDLGLMQLPIEEAAAHATDHQVDPQHAA